MNVVVHFMCRPAATLIIDIYYILNLLLSSRLAYKIDINMFALLSLLVILKAYAGYKSHNPLFYGV